MCIYFCGWKTFLNSDHSAFFFLNRFYPCRVTKDYQMYWVYLFMRVNVFLIVILEAKHKLCLFSHYFLVVDVLFSWRSDKNDRRCKTWPGPWNNGYAETGTTRTPPSWKRKSWLATPRWPTHRSPIGSPTPGGDWRTPLREITSPGPQESRSTIAASLATRNCSASVLTIAVCLIRMIMVRGLEKFLAKKMEATRGEEGGSLGNMLPVFTGNYERVYVNGLKVWFNHWSTVRHVGTHHGAMRLDVWKLSFTLSDGWPNYMTSVENRRHLANLSAAGTNNYVTLSVPIDKVVASPYNKDRFEDGLIISHRQLLMKISTNPEKMIIGGETRSGLKIDFALLYDVVAFLFLDEIQVCSPGNNIRFLGSLKKSLSFYHKWLLQTQSWLWLQFLDRYC